MATARRHSTQALLSAARFPEPLFITLTIGPRGRYALRTALDEFRTALFDWRRKALVKQFVRGATGGIEPKYSAGGVPQWLVHAHLLLDAALGTDFDALGRAWLAATSGKGRLLVPKLGAAVFSLDKAAAYVTKHVDWSPAPGTLPDEMLAQLFGAMKGRRLLVRWGTARNPGPESGKKCREYRKVNPGLLFSISRRPRAGAARCRSS